MIKSIINRLMDTGTPFRIGGGATDLAAVKDTPPQTPAVFVFSGTERSEKDATIGRRVRQRAAVDISIVICTSNLSATHGAAAAEDIEELKTFVRGRVLGFKPENALDPLQHVEGELQQAFAGTVWWEDVFTTTHFVKEDT